MLAGPAICSSCFSGLCIFQKLRSVLMSASKFKTIKSSVDKRIILCQKIPSAINKSLLNKGNKLVSAGYIITILR